MLATKIVGDEIASPYCNCQLIMNMNEVGFILVEMAVGLYFPTMGTAKAILVPDHFRATMVNLFYVPMNVFLVVVPLLASFGVQFPVEYQLYTCSAGFFIGAGFLLRLSFLTSDQDEAGDVSLLTDDEDQDGGSEVSMLWACCIKCKCMDVGYSLSAVFSSEYVTTKS